MLNVMQQILHQWELGTILAARPPETGSVNQVILVTTTRGRYVLRGYRHDDRAPVEREHAIICAVRRQGLPAVGPLLLPDGGSFLEFDGHNYALFPFARGHQVSRRHLGVTEAAAMGHFLAKVHCALQHIPAEHWKQRSFDVYYDTTLARMDRLEALVGSREDDDPVDDLVLDRLHGQRSWLNALPPTARVDFGSLPQQVIHGDYQETNLFFDSGQVSAIVDWDQTYVAPRAWDVMRTLHLSLSFDADLCSSFLNSYHAELPLALDELDFISAAYDVKVSHDLWVYESLYLDNNQRVRAFIQPGAFVPVSSQWQRLRSRIG